MSTQVSQLAEMGRELGEAIADTPAYERFEEARAAVQNDDDAQAKIAEVERLRDEFVSARETGQATQEHVAKLQTAQNDLHSMPVMEEYLNAQEALQSQLEDVNRAISDPLSVDFGGEAGGCCQD
ncbi:YlbF family regulator [Haloplanus natans]|uniref:YlbF family regulator n=1 Tax=Haloplanus natans TaxID=376171 RepID=UPI000677D829|nr:YlbF family regulator [Haloplanus natans]